MSRAKVMAAVSGIVAVSTSMMMSAPAVAVVRPADGGCSDSYKISNVTYDGKDYDETYSVDGQYPGTISISKSISHSNSWSATLGVTASVVSAGVGFSVTKEASTTASYSLNTKDTGKGKGTYTVYVDNVISEYYFNVTHTNRICTTTHGTGWAYKWTKYSYGWYKD